MRLWAKLFVILSCVWLTACVPPANNSSIIVQNASTPNKPNANLQTNTSFTPAANYAQPVPAERPTEAPTSAQSSASTIIDGVPPLIIPVAGIRREALQDTFTDSRSEGRSHDAIDIIAPQGTNVFAAADGEIAQFHDSVRGGITIYQYSLDKKLIYYYAHLERRADNLKVGDFIRQGTVIGYVGDTGNSGAGNFHLHFAVWKINDPKRIWEGDNINPYPLLSQPK